MPGVMANRPRQCSFYQTENMGIRKFQAGTWQTEKRNIEEVGGNPSKWRRARGSLDTIAEKIGPIQPKVIATR